MDAFEPEPFGKYFRKDILPKLIDFIDPAFNDLRKTDPQQWKRIAQKMIQQGPYDRIEEIRDMESAFEDILQMVTDGLKESIPEVVRQLKEAIEQHYVKNGQALDDLIRSSPDEATMSSRESADAILKTMGFKYNPNDPR